MVKNLLIGCGILAVGSVVVGIAVIVIAAIAVSSDLKSKALFTGDAGDVTVRVTGNAGAFRGSLGSGANQRSVDGTTPAAFTLAGDESSGIFVAVLQKEGEGGTLTVTLDGCPDGEQASQSTSAPYGAVSVTC